MADNNELDKTIEELEAEVLAELEEANGPKAGAVPAEKDDKSNEADDLGGADGDEKDTDKDREIGKKAASAAKKASDPKAKSSDASAKMEAKKVKEEDDDEEKEDEEEDEEEVSKEKMDESTLKTKSQHLEYFGKMKASEVKEMLAAYQTSLAEADEEDEDDEEEDMEEALKQETAVEKTIKEIDVGEDVDALMNGEDNLSEEFKTKAATIFEAAVKSKVRTEAHRIYEEIRAEKDSEMETIKEELTTQVDTYLNYVVEEWTKENELAIERGLKGEIAEDFIGGLKQLFEDHYIDVPDEKYDVLEAQSEKITELEDKLNEEIQKNVEIIMMASSGPPSKLTS